MSVESEQVGFAMSLFFIIIAYNNSYSLWLDFISLLEVYNEELLLVRTTVHINNVYKS